MQICGYMASKQVAIEDADVIVTTYQSLLSHQARTALGLTNLTGKIVVMDEAHNILEQINSSNSALITFQQLTLVSR